MIKEAGAVCFRGEKRNSGSDRPQITPQREQEHGGRGVADHTDYNRS